MEASKMSILKTFARALRLIATYSVANVEAAMEYRVSFWMQIITLIANDSLWLFFWWTYFHQFPLTHGWQATDIIILWAVAACGFGICMGIFGNARSLAALIMNGGLDAYLGMPRYALLHACIATSDPTAWEISSSPWGRLRCSCILTCGTSPCLCCWHCK